VEVSARGGGVVVEGAGWFGPIADSGVIV